MSKPEETPTSMAVRKATAAVLIQQHQLNDAAFASIMVALWALADSVGCEYHFRRQILRACRDIPVLPERIANALTDLVLLDEVELRQAEDPAKAEPMRAVIIIEDGEKGVRVRAKHDGVPSDSPVGDMVGFLMDRARQR